MKDHQETLVTRILKDPAVESLTSHIGIDGTNATLNSGRLLITLKPYEDREHAREILHRLQMELNALDIADRFQQPLHDHTGMFAVLVGF